MADESKDGLEDGLEDGKEEGCCVSKNAARDKPWRKPQWLCVC
jgi:hypothetical protein